MPGSEEASFALRPHSPLAYHLVAGLADVPGRAPRTQGQHSSKRLRMLAGMVSALVGGLETIPAQVVNAKQARQAVL